MADICARNEPTQRDSWLSLLVELDRPLTPGFMTAGYTALGRYIFLASCADEAEQAPRPLFAVRG